MLSFTKRAEVGVGTLIIFISLLLVAAIASGVVIQTAGSVQEKALTTGSQARDEVVTGIRTLEVAAINVANSSINEITQIIRLTPGSGTLKFDSFLITYNMANASSTLTYAGEGSGVSNNVSGYYIFSEEEFGAVWGADSWRNSVDVDRFSYQNINTLDLDLDGVNDSVIMCYRFQAGNPCTEIPAWDQAQFHLRYLVFNITSAGLIIVPLLNYSMTGTVDANVATGENFANYMHPIYNNSVNDGEVFGYFTVTGTNTGGRDLDPLQLHVYPLSTDIQNLDGDLLQDDFVINQTHIIFRLSSDGNISIPLGVNLGSGAQVIDVDQDLVNDDGETLGHLRFNGTTSKANFVDEGVTLLLTPENSGNGVYSIEYLQSSRDHRAGRLTTGEIAKIYFATPQPLGGDELVSIVLTPKVGNTLKNEFVTPDVLADTVVVLYP